jgi:membrane protein
VAALKIPLHAANAGFFIVLSVFPALLLMLSLLRYTHLEVGDLLELLSSILPEALWDTAEELIISIYQSTSASVVGVSAVTALWSASRGIHGLLGGLNAVYGVEEDRGYFRTRFVSMVYTVAFLVVLLLTLGLHVFGTGLLGVLRRSDAPFVRFLLDIIDFRFFLLLGLQTAIFTAMFLALPNRRSRLRDSLPGALLASSGWLIFSDLYSIYVAHFAKLTNVYGSVYAVALSMLWLYCCMSIVFYGGALNRYLMER